MPNIDANPEAFGLTVVGTAYEDGLCYEFDLFIVWRDASGGLRWASDSGCSCPTPFEDITLDDTAQGTVAEAHAALREWAGNTPGKQASATELHRTLAEITDQDTKTGDTKMQRITIRLALELARSLNDADVKDRETNHEYARGQANLIGDLFGLPLGDWNEPIYDTITGVKSVDEFIDDLVDALRERP